MSFNSLCIVSVNTFSKGNADKNGLLPVILNVVAGKSPNRTVLSGTVAEMNGFETGKTYLASVREVEANDYGRQFVWAKLKEVSAVEIVEAASKMSKAEIFSIERITSEATQTINQEAAAFDE